jgi:RHS repeat-associated protein
LAEANLTPRVASPFGQRDVHPAVAAAIDYVQKGYDADLGLARMGVRDYDPEINRFTTPDPLYLERPELCLKSPVECNLYSYALNSPLQYSDPAGRSVVPFVDLGFMLVDIGLYAWHSAHGQHAEASVDLAALGMDAAFALLPGPPGAGLAYRAAGHVAAEVVVHAGERRAIQGAVKALQVGSIASDGLSSMMKNNEGKGNADGAGGGGNIVYRGGSRTPDNLTPRPGRDMAGDKRGLSTFETLEKATPPGGKAQAIDTSKLKCLGTHCTPDGHVSLRPGTQAELEEWAATKGTGTVHPYTQEVLDAVVETVRRTK